MKYHKYMAKKPFVPVFDNDLAAMDPEVWAREALEMLQENIVSPSLVYRDFDATIASYGDVVNTRMPSAFVMKRKIDSDDVTVQNADVTNVPVALNQHCHTSFLLKDGQISRSIQSLFDLFLNPAVRSLGTGMDQILLGQVYQFLGNPAGKLQTMDSTNAKDYILQARQVLNENKVPLAGRNLIWGSSAETFALQQELFTDVASSGSREGLVEGTLGRKFGFNNFMCQNMSEVVTGNTKVTGAINSASGHAAGVTSITVDGLSAAIANGTWFTVAGDMRPRRVTGTTGGSTPTAIAFTPALDYAVADNAVVTLYTPGAVNLGAGYAAGWIKEIVVDGFSVAPQVGQGITFGTASDIYSVIEVNGTTGITLDRPLAAAIADNAVVGILPPGGYNFGFDRGAVALVTRPLAMPTPMSGVRAAVINAYDMSIRVVMTYDGNKQGTLVTLDLLAGVATLDSDRGCVMYS